MSVGLVILIGIVIGTISTFMLGLLFMALTDFREKSFSVPIAIIVGVMMAFIVSISLSNKCQPQASDDTYAKLIAEESAEPKEIRDYRKKLYAEVGADIIRQKKKIRAEVEANAKKMLAEYRERQEKAKLDAEIAKSREKTLSDVNEQIKPCIEYDKKYKAAVAEVILLDDVEMEVKSEGKTLKIDKAGVYKF